MSAPKLKRHEGSWVATNKTTGQVREIFDRESAVFAALSDNWQVETIGDYLARINAAARETL